MWQQNMPVDSHLLPRKKLFELNANVAGMANLHMPVSSDMLAFRTIHNGIEFWDLILEKTDQIYYNSGGDRYVCSETRTLTIYPAEKRAIVMKIEKIWRNGALYHSRVKPVNLRW